jgi:hypothetical protein
MGRRALMLVATVAAAVVLPAGAALLVAVPKSVEAGIPLLLSLSRPRWTLRPNCAKPSRLRGSWCM